VVLPARFCSACGSPLPSGEDDAGSPPCRPGPGGRLTAQHTSLVRAVALSRADYLRSSYYRDPSTGQRTAHPLEEKEWSRFAADWAVEPIACIRAMNAAIAKLRTPVRIQRYLQAAVELETLMDHGASRAPEGRVFSGIPCYIMDGYTDMGRNPSPTRRGGREKIRVDKRRLKAWLIESRWRALACKPGLEELLAGFYEVVRRSLRLDEARVRHLSLDSGDRSIDLSRFLDDGVGLCRHLSILYQLCLQEAAIPARVVKGTLRILGIGGRHAWNLAWLRGRVALIDVTLPSRRGPLILVGASQEEVYRMANEGDRRYIPTPDEENHYKIGGSAD
jgi:transglutaminase superfamily protein